MPEPEPRDYLLYLKLDFDVDSQLNAIGAALRRNRNADEQIEKEIKTMEEHTRHLTGISAQWGLDSWIDALHYSTYHSAANSMSAVGMIAPFIETVFYQCLRGIGTEFYPASHPSQPHARWAANPAVQWDCHFVVTDRTPEKNLVAGIIQLSEAVGLLARLPADLPPTISALVAYRNKMFHHGLEWPMDERRAFAERIAREKWPADWFSKAETGNEPWIFYMSDKFTDHCLNTIQQTLDVSGLFVRDVLLPLRG